jgi:hypothetical protein
LLYSSGLAPLPWERGWGEAYTSPWVKCVGEVPEKAVNELFIKNGEKLLTKM